jgi:hypothetical protein
MLRMTMVMRTERPTRNMVKSKYLPSKGTASDVDGMISEMSKKNMVCDRRMEMQRATFSPESAGR